MEEQKKKPGAVSAKAERDARLAAELRANLKRRKAVARDRDPEDKPSRADDFGDA